MKRLKIAIFSGAIPSTTFIEHLIEGVAKTYEVYLFGVVETKTSYNHPHIKIISTPRVHGLNLLFTMYRGVLLGVKRPKDLQRLGREIKRFNKRYDKWIWFSKFLPIILYKPDVLHMQWARDLEFYWFLQDSFEIPIVVSLRGAHINYTPIVTPKVGELYRQLFPKVKGFHAVSNAIRHEAEGYGATPERIKVICSPLPASLFNQFEVLAFSPSNSIKILSVGRFHWKKGYSFGLKAVAELKRRGVDCTYTIISSNALTEDLLFQIHDMGLDDVVNIEKGVTQDSLFKTMKAYDVMLLPSLEEGIANVVLEAMALGVPVISTDCGGMAEVVRPGETGWLVPVRDPEAMAKAVLEVMHTSEEDLQRIAQNAHDLVKAEFCAERSIQQFLELYDQVLGGVITSETRAK
ncbi:glycosyltransferase family 4 protein [Mangrovimonas sp. TPBH4]|uniref:glycosyltransferase family 4 protein n=1 Tax=Mangrovimonas sp. TPBH4 TaxID=1645914 RepID=UPI0006B5830F|nr:glycosyltransferase family 4 protein [Mangrovimonas sp. TPBH4]